MSRSTSRLSMRSRSRSFEVEAEGLVDLDEVDAIEVNFEVDVEVAVEVVDEVEVGGALLKKMHSLLK